MSPPNATHQPDTPAARPQRGSVEGTGLEPGYSGAEAWANPGPEGERLWPLDGPSSLLGHIATLLTRRLNRQYQSALGVSLSSVRLLSTLHRMGPSTLKQLVEATGMDKAQVSRTMGGMVRSGQIGFSGPLKNPTRFTARVRAVLTPEGEALFQRALVVARAHHMEVLATLPPDDRRSLYHVLRRLIVEAAAWDTDAESPVG